jgi:CTP:molybdopterin cytidylyltransferase MocA
MKSVGAIVLAAGASQRLGQPKQLVALRGEPLLARVLRLARDAESAPVIPVLGAHFAAICRRIDFGDAIPVFNERWEQGISSSIQCGLRELVVRAPQIDAALILTCDQPHLTAAHLSALIAAWRKQSGDAIVASAYAGTRGVPAIFPRSAFASLFALTGDRGARIVLAAPPCPVVTVLFAEGEVDVDVPRDLDTLSEE